MENAIPLLHKAVAVTKAYIRDVELAVLGFVQSDSPSFAENVPPKKQQLSTCASICARWGLFPRGEQSLDRILSSFALLPFAVKKPSLLYLLKNAHDDSSIASEENRLFAEVLSGAIELYLCDWVETAMGNGNRLDDADLAAAIEERVLSSMGSQSSSTSSNGFSFVPSSIVPKFLSSSKRTNDQSQMAAWYWSGLILKLRAFAFIRWTEILGLLSGQRTDEFILNRLTGMASTGGHTGAFTVALLAHDLRPKTLAASHLPALLIQAYGNAEEDATKMALLETLRTVLERADLSSSPDAIRVANKALVLAESALRGSREVKDAALRLVAAMLAKTLEDDYDLLYEKLFQKRVIKALQGTDAKKFTRALELGRVLLENAKTTVMKRKLAQALSSEVFEKQKSAVRVILKSGLMNPDEDYCLADLARLIFLTDTITGSTKTFPALFAANEEEFSTSRRTVIGLMALKLVLLDATRVIFPAEAMERLCALLETNVGPPMELIAFSTTSHDWTHLLATTPAPSPEDLFFANMILTPSSLSVDAKSKLFLRRYRLSERTYLHDLETKLRSYESTGDVDSVEETRVVVASLGIECLAVGRKAIHAQQQRPSAPKMSLTVRLPPVSFMQAHHHPLVRSTSASAMKNVAQMSFADYLSVLRAMRDHVAAYMDLAEEFASFIKVDCAQQQEQAVLDMSKDLGVQIEALSVSLCTVGLERIGREVAIVGERKQLFSSNGQGARYIRCCDESLDVVQTALACSLQVQQEVVRILSSWIGGAKLTASTKPFYNLLMTRGISVLVALDASRAPLESVVFDSRGTSMDIVRSADVSEKSAVNVLSRALQHWKQSVQSSNNNNNLSFMTSSPGQGTLSTGPRKSFSVLRRLANTATLTANASMSSPPPPSMSANEETTEEDEMLIGITRRVLESKSALTSSLYENHSDSMVLKLVREILYILSGALPSFPLKRRKVSPKFASEFCFVASLALELVCEWVEAATGKCAAMVCNIKLGDEMWARAERRKMFAFLRRMGGYSEMSFQLGEANQTEALKTMRHVLRLGPVSLGQVADAPDKDLWGVLLRDAALCDLYLAAHLHSLLPSYFSKAFPPHLDGTCSSFGLVQSIVNALRVQLDVNMKHGKPPKLVWPDKVSRALVLATALLSPFDSGADSLSDEEVAELVCIALSSTPDTSTATFFEMNMLNRELKRLETTERRKRLATVCARTCPELASDVADLLWDRRCFSVSEPFVAELGENPQSAFEKVWMLGAPAQIWKMFQDETSCLNFLVSKAGVDEGMERAGGLVKQVASKCAWETVEQVLLPLMSISTCAFVSICDRAVDLLENLFETHQSGDVKSKESLIQLLLMSFHHQPLIEQLVRWLRLKGLENDTLGAIWMLTSKNHPINLVCACLYSLDAPLCRDLLDECLVRLLSSSDNATTDLYCELKTLKCFPVRFLPKEEAFILASKGPSTWTLKCLIHLVMAANPSESFGFVLPLTLTYLCDLWLCINHPLIDQVETLVMALLEHEKEDEQLFERAFWIGLERLLRLAMKQGSPWSLDETNLTASSSLTFKVLRRIARTNGEWSKSLDLVVSASPDVELSQVSEETLLLLFRCAKEFARETWMVRALSSPQARVGLASVALREILCEADFAGSVRLSTAAAQLVNRCRTTTAPASDLCDRYIGPTEWKEMMKRSERAWLDTVESISRGFGSSNGTSSFRQRTRKSFVTVRPKRPLRDSSANDSMSDSSRLPSLSGTTDVVTNKRAPPKPIMDVRDALRDDYARMRLLAHAADRGIPQDLVLAYETASYVPELDKDELWQSFQRSRWWLFDEEEDVPSLMH